MNINQLRNSKYLKKEDCGPNGVIATIRDLEQVNVAMEDEPEDLKWVINFEEDLKPMVLNQTNAGRIAAITGHQDTDGWPGSKIILYNDPEITFGGKMVGGIRVRELKKKTAPPTVPGKPSIKGKIALPAEDPGYEEPDLDDVPH